MSENDAKDGEIVEVVGEIKAYDSYRAGLAELQKNNAVLVFDYESRKGQKEARSHIFQLRKSRSALDTARKEEKAASRIYGQKVDAEAKAIETVILDMIDVHLAPVEAAEQREEKRVSDIAEMIEDFDRIVTTSVGLREMIPNLAKIKDRHIDDSFGEFMDEAQGAKDRAIASLTEMIATAEKAESDAAELEILRKQQAERDEKDRLEREEKEKKERDERIRQEGIEQERLAGEKRERELIEQAEQADREKKEAAEKAERDQKEAVAEAERKASEKAQIAESNRLAKEETTRREAERKAANKRHQAKINNEAVACLDENLPNRITTADAKEIVKLIALGKIKNVSINY